jgi:hypothetical protein
MKSATIRNLQLLFKNMIFFFLGRSPPRRILFINLFHLDPKGCKLMKINTSFRIRGRERNFFTSFLNKKILPDNSNLAFRSVKL